MYRVLVLLIMIVSWISMSAVSASESIDELGKPKKAGFEVIGKKPPKRFIEMDLGGIRTRGAQLPDGKRDLEARIRLRNRRALERERKARAKEEEIAKADTEQSDGGKPKRNNKKRAKKSDAKADKLAKKSADKKRKRKKKKSKRKSVKQDVDQTTEITIE